MTTRDQNVQERQKANDAFMSEILRDAILHQRIVSPDGETPFWLAMWQVRNAQREREWDQHQHGSEYGWMQWIADRNGAP